MATASHREMRLSAHALGAQFRIFKLHWHAPKSDATHNDHRPLASAILRRQGMAADETGDQPDGRSAHITSCFVDTATPLGNDDPCSIHSASLCRRVAAPTRLTALQHCSTSVLPQCFSACANAPVPVTLRRGRDRSLVYHD